MDDGLQRVLLHHLLNALLQLLVGFVYVGQIHDNFEREAHQLLLAQVAPDEGARRTHETLVHNRLRVFLVEREVADRLEALLEGVGLEVLGFGLQVENLLQHVDHAQFAQPLFVLHVLLAQTVVEDAYIADQHMLPGVLLHQEMREADYVGL